MANFTEIDWETWPRRPYFEHYNANLPCTYSLTTELDITNIRRAGRRPYPTLIHAITSSVNRHEEFRLALNDAGVLGHYDELVPCYTVFDPDSETFTSVWTPCHPSLDAFLEAYEKDVSLYGSARIPDGKPGCPANSFPISMIPWIGFTSFNLNLRKGYEYYAPIFTMGRFEAEGGRTTIPLSIQVHHAACDAFHVARLVRDIQKTIDRIDSRPNASHSSGL